MSDATRRGRGAAIVAGAALLPLLLGSPAALGDAFDPVAIAVDAPAIARSDRPLAVTATVAADPDALTGTDGPVRVRMKLATVCGGSFEGTDGVTLLDEPLEPQPRAGTALRASATGRARPARAGVQSVCAFVASANDERQYATDVDATVDVSARCTTAARRVERAERAAKRARKALRTARTARRRHRTATTLRRVQRTRRSALRAAARARRSATTARARCGGVLW